MDIKRSLMKKPFQSLNKWVIAAAGISLQVVFAWSLYAMARMPPEANLSSHEFSSSPSGQFNATPANRGPYDNGEKALYKSEDAPYENTINEPIKAGTLPDNVGYTDPSNNPTRNTGVLSH